MAKQKKSKNRKKSAPPKNIYKPQKTARIVNEALEISRGGDPVKARQMLLTASERDPRHPAIWLNLGISCNILHDFAGACKAFANAVKYDAGNLKRIMGMGTGHLSAGRFREAQACYEGCCYEAAQLPQTWYHNAQALLALGREEEALESFEKARGSDSPFLPAYYGVSLCRELSADELAEVEKLLQGAGEQVAKYGYFAQALAKHRAADSSEAFELMTKANRIAARDSKQTPAQAAQDLSGHVELMQRLFTREFFSERAGWGRTDVAPVFIVGMPLSGTRVLGQALAARDNINYTGEFTWCNQVIFKLLSDNGNDFNKLIDSLDEGMVGNLANEYLRSHTPNSADGAIYLDNNPYNFLNLWLVALMFPQAKVINCRRDEACNMFACFAGDVFGQPFTLDLLAIREYFGGYNRIMEFWGAVLPFAVHDYKAGADFTELGSRLGLPVLSGQVTLGAYELAMFAEDNIEPYRKFLPTEESMLDFSGSSLDGAAGNAGGLQLDFGSGAAKDEGGLKLNFGAGGAGNDDNKRDEGLKLNF